MIGMLCYIGQTSKKIETRITEHKNAIKRHDLRSLPAAHTYDNCHTFNWTETQLLGRAQTKHAREFKEAWYSTDSNTINRHIDIPTIYLQLKTLHRSSTNIDVNMTNTNNVALMSTSTTQHSNHSNNNTPNNKVLSTIKKHPSTTNNIRSTSKQPIRRSQRIRSQQRET